MIRVLAPGLAAILLLGAGQAVAATDSTAASPQATSPAPAVSPAHTSHLDPSEVVCKREEVSGSRLGGARVCHTRQEWADMAARYRDDTTKLQQNSTSFGPH